MANSYIKMISLLFNGNDQSASFDNFSGDEDERRNSFRGTRGNNEQKRTRRENNVDGDGSVRRAASRVPLRLLRSALLLRRRRHLRFHGDQRTSCSQSRTDSTARDSRTKTKENLNT